MRPLRLKLVGLRSYRQEQEVSFEDVSLVAIVGDTGAGKSSLLEALTVALYGTSTWDARETKQLICDGATTLQVSLDFRADGKVWRVERAISRGTYPPARHTLECLDGGERLDKKDAVDAKIRQLVGLDYDAFLRSVVLPQGRFAALLQAKPAERAQILKGILRIDRLDAVREQAREARDRMVPVTDGLRERRSKLLPDPAAAEADAAQRLGVAAAQRDSAKAAREKVAGARERGRKAGERRKLLESLIGRAAEGRVNGAAATFGILVERDTEIAAELARNEASLLQSRAQEEELLADIEEAEKKGAGPVSLGHAKNGLTLIADELPLLSAEAKTVEKEEASIAKDAGDLERAEGMLGAFTAAEADAKKALAERQIEARRAAETLKSAERLLKELQAARTEEVKAANKAGKVKTELAQAKEALAAAEADAKKSEGKHEEAESATRAAAQKHAAHHASEGLKSGEPCPVCERALPEGWKAPRAPAVEAAQKKLEKARADLDKAREKVATARSRAEATDEKAAEANAEVAERRAGALEAAKALSALLSGVSPVGGDMAILAVALAANEAEARALAEAEAHAQKTRDIVTRAKAELDGAKKRLKERRDALEKSKTTLAVRRKRLDDTASKLPKDLRPGVAAASENTGSLAGVSTADIAAMIARVDVRRARIDEVVRRLEEARAARRALEIEKGRLAEQRQREIVAKAGALDVQLATYRERLLLLAEALPAEPPSPKPDTASLPELAEWAGGFEQAAADLLSAANGAVETARAEAVSVEEEVRRTLEASGVDSEAALDAAHSRAEGQHAAAAVDLERARAEKPLAAALDGRIDRAQGLAAALSEVTRLCADGKLIHHVVHRRQRVLLAVASELLGSMTRNRYGFSEDFDVVDKLSGQARGTRTLSGGETFLASLALSLALVELAGRAGGRLEALFLDEGFGSLDASSLAEALDALTQKAEGGRLVAVISHLKSVAESIDKVLAVRMSPGGSTVRWISAEERDKMLSEDVERGLIA